MKSKDIRTYISQLSKSTTREEQMLIKAFLSGTYKTDYDQVMAIIDRKIAVPRISRDIIENAVECSKLFNEAMSLSQNLTEKQQKDADLNRALLAQAFRDYCYQTISSYGIRIKP